MPRGRDVRSVFDFCTFLVYYSIIQQCERPATGEFSLRNMANFNITLSILIIAKYYQEFLRRTKLLNDVVV